MHAFEVGKLYPAPTMRRVILSAVLCILAGCGPSTPGGGPSTPGGGPSTPGGGKLTHEAVHKAVWGANPDQVRQALGAPEEVMDPAVVNGDGDGVWWVYTKQTTDEKTGQMDSYAIVLFKGGRCVDVVFGAKGEPPTRYGKPGGRASKATISATISGKVTYNGKPLTGGTLTLYSSTGAPYPVSIKDDGTFNVSGTPIGQMGVGIDTGPAPVAPPAGSTAPQRPPHMDLPPKYKDPKTSGLTWDVKAGKNTKDFPLTD